MSRNGSNPSKDETLNSDTAIPENIGSFEPPNPYSFFMDRELNGEHLPRKYKEKLLIDEIKRNRKEALEFNKSDPQRSLNAVRRAAQLGDIVSLDILLTCYTGIGPASTGIIGEYFMKIDLEPYKDLIEPDKNLAFQTRHDLINSGDCLAATELANDYFKCQDTKKALEYFKTAALLGSYMAREILAQLITGPSCSPEIFKLAISTQLEIESSPKIAKPKIPELYKSEHPRGEDRCLPDFSPYYMHKGLSKTLSKEDRKASSALYFFRGLFLVPNNPKALELLEHPTSQENFNKIKTFIKFCHEFKIASPLYATIIHEFKEWKIPLSMIGLKNEFELLGPNDLESKEEMEDDTQLRLSQ